MQPTTEQKKTLNAVFLNLAIMYEMRRYGATWENLLQLYLKEASTAGDKKVLEFCNKILSCPSPDLAMDRSIEVFFRSF